MTQNVRKPSSTSKMSVQKVIIRSRASLNYDLRGHSIITPSLAPNPFNDETKIIPTLKDITNINGPSYESFTKKNIFF